MSPCERLTGNLYQMLARGIVCRETARAYSRRYQIISYHVQSFAGDRSLIQCSRYYGRLSLDSVRKVYQKASTGISAIDNSELESLGILIGLTICQSIAEPIALFVYFATKSTSFFTTAKVVQKPSHSCIYSAVG